MKYIVSISRTAYEDFIVEAKSEKEAKSKAEEAAYNYDGWNSATADYHVDDVNMKKHKENTHG